MQYDTTPAVYLIKLVAVLRELGMPVNDMLRHSNATAGDLADRDRAVSLSTYLNAIEYAMEQFDIPDLGFQVGEHTTVLEHGVLGYALLSSANLRESLQRYVRYQYLQGPLLEIEFSSNDAIAAMTARPRSGRWKLSPAAMKYIVQEWLVGWNQWCPIIGKQGYFFDHVRLSYPQPGKQNHYADHLGCTVSFGNPETTAVFSATSLDRPLEYADDSIAALCTAQCERLLEVLDKPSGLKADIHRLLASSPGEVPSMDDMAGKLHLGTRTMRRRLRQEGTTYQDVVKRFRVAMSKRYLRETRLPANEIAALVGYADPANLYRVFREETGITPHEFRATQ